MSGVWLSINFPTTPASSLEFSIYILSVKTAFSKISLELFLKHLQMNSKISSASLNWRSGLNK